MSLSYSISKMGNGHVRFSCSEKSRGFTINPFNTSHLEDTVRDVSAGLTADGHEVVDKRAKPKADSE